MRLAMLSTGKIITIHNTLVYRSLDWNEKIKNYLLGNVRCFFFNVQFYDVTTVSNNLPNRNQQSFIFKSGSMLHTHCCFAIAFNP